MILDDVYEVVLREWPTDAGAWILYESERVNGNWSNILEQARAHVSGDTLLDFVLIELHEVMTGADDPMQEGLEALDNAVRDLEHIAEALRAEEIK